MTLSFAVLRFPPFGEEIVRVEKLLPRCVTHVHCRLESGEEETYALTFRLMPDISHNLTPTPAGPVCHEVGIYELEEITVVDTHYELYDVTKVVARTDN
jgi:hypothetical protein